MTARTSSHGEDAGSMAWSYLELANFNGGSGDWMETTDPGEHLAAVAFTPEDIWLKHERLAKEFGDEKCNTVTAT